MSRTCLFAMDEKEKNESIDGIRPEEKPIEECSYDEIVESTVPDLFQKFKIMPRDSRLNVVSSYLLANALSSQSSMPAETKVEYLKEYGRNERAMAADSGGSKDDDDPLFGRG